jgi:hypothetical protein
MLHTFRQEEVLTQLQHLDPLDKLAQRAVVDAAGAAAEPQSEKP